MAAETPGTSGNLPQVRVSDAEREAIVDRLNDATAEGRLTLEEFSERVTAALAARTQGDLDALVADLPSQTRGYPARPAAVGGERTSKVALVGSVKRSGRWRLDRDMAIGVIVGSVKLDLRQAEIAASVVDMHVYTTLGSVKIWIPHGVSVEISGATVLGSRTIAEDAPLPRAPLVRLRIDTVVGSVKVYRRPSKSYWH